MSINNLLHTTEAIIYLWYRVRLQKAFGFPVKKFSVALIVWNCEQ